MKAIIHSKPSWVLTLLILCVFFVTPLGYSQTEPYEQTDLTISSVLLPETVSQGQEFGSQTRVTIYNQGTTIIEGGYYLELVVSSDRDAPIQSAPPTTTFIEDGLLPNGRITMPTMEPESTVTLTFPGVTMVTDAPLDELIFICAVIDPEDVIDERWRGYHDGYGVNKLCMPIDVIGGSQTGTPPSPPTDEPPPQLLDPPSDTPQTQTANGTLGDYDADGDCHLSDVEFFNVVDDWTSESASDTLFFSAIDAWMAQREVCPASSSASQSLHISMSTQGMAFSSASSTMPLQIEIFDLNGAVVVSLSAPGNRLIWNLRDSQGKSIANGVYFARDRANGDLRKFAVIR